MSRGLNPTRPVSRRLIFEPDARITCICASGYATDTANQGCSVCKIGQYKAAAGAGNCIPCPVGTTTLAAGASVCVLPGGGSAGGTPRAALHSRTPSDAAAAGTSLGSSSGTAMGVAAAPTAHHPPSPSATTTSAAATPTATASPATAAATTLMLRHIPNKYTPAMVLAALDAAPGVGGRYDFFYMPTDARHGHANLGFAFVNCVDGAAADAVVAAFQGAPWPAFHSRKVCAVCPARVQGRAALAAHFRGCARFGGGSEGGNGNGNGNGNGGGSSGCGRPLTFEVEGGGGGGGEAPAAAQAEEAPPAPAAAAAAEEAVPPTTTTTATTTPSREKGKRKKLV